MKIFVAKLNFKTKEDLLRSTFEQFGAVRSAKIVLDRDTKKSKGYGFIEMESDADAKLAIENLDGSSLDGREIVVQESNK